MWRCLMWLTDSKEMKLVTEAFASKTACVRFCEKVQETIPKPWRVESYEFWIES